MKNPIEIKQNIGIGKGDVELYHSVSIDGEVVIEETKGDSIVGSFISLLYSFAGGVYIPRTLWGHGDWQDEFDSYASISVTGVTSGVQTVISFSSFTTGASPQITGFVGDYEPLNGRHTPVSTTSTSMTLDIDSSLFGALDLTNNPTIIRLSPAPLLNNDRSQIFTFDNPEIRLGASNRAVDLDDQVVVSEILQGSGANELEYALVSVSQPASDGNDVIIELSRSVSNNSGGAIAIKEAGLYTKSAEISSATGAWVVIARDLFTTSIADGKTATVTYKLSTSLGVEGGLLRQFLDIFHAHIGTSGKSTKQIDGTSVNKSRSIGNWMMVSPGGNNIQYPTYSGYVGQFGGIQVGQGITAVTTDDFSIEDRFTHGEGSVLTVSGTTGNLVININAVNYTEAFNTDAATTATNWLASHASTLSGLGTPIIATTEDTAKIRIEGSGSSVFIDNSTGDMAFVVKGELKYYGTLVENFLYGDTPGEASFDIIRLFENSSGADIEIRETALNAALAESALVQMFCISRHVLTTPVTVANGEILKVTYTISVSV